jgi:hypothetical protein
VLKIHETTRTDGSLAPTALFVEDGVVGLQSDEGVFALPDGALEAVMARFGKPLEPSEQLIPVAVLDLGDGRRLRHVRHLAAWDVIARDWLVLEIAGEEPLCALATTVAGALGHLARAAAERTS